MRQETKDLNPPTPARVLISHRGGLRGWSLFSLSASQARRSVNFNPPIKNVGHVLPICIAQCSHLVPFFSQGLLPARDFLSGIKLSRLGCDLARYTACVLYNPPQTFLSDECSTWVLTGFSRISDRYREVFRRHFWIIYF